MSGAANSFPFLYPGLEHEVTDPGQLYFEPSGNVYNPQIQRELSLIGPQGIFGPPSGFGNGGFSSPSGHGSSAGGPSKLVGALSDLAVVGEAFASAESLNSPDVWFGFGGSEFGIKLPIPLLGNLLCFINCANNNGDQPTRPPHETSQTYLILGIRLINGQKSSANPWIIRIADKTYGLPAEFWSWYHRKGKKPGDPDIGSRQDALKWYQTWIAEGKPDAEGHRTVKSSNSNNVLVVPLPVPYTSPPPIPLTVPDPTVPFTVPDPFLVF